MTSFVDASLIALAVTFVQSQGLNVPEHPQVVYTIETTEKITELVQASKGIRAIGTCYRENGKLLVHVSKDLDLRSVIGFSTLVHEVVHVTQGCPLRKDVGEAGMVRAENQAYAIQNKFLEWANSNYRVVSPYDPKLKQDLLIMEKELQRLKEEAEQMRKQLESNVNKLNTLKRGER